MKRAVLLIVGVAVSVGCFALSMRGTDLTTLKQGFRDANYFTLPLMLALLFAFYWLKTLRWKWLLAPVATLSVRDLFPPMLMGFAANNLLPAHLGEFVRVFVVHKKHRIPASTVLSTVVLERIFDVLAILALFGIGIAYSGDLPEDYQRSAVLFGSGAALVVFAVVLYLVWTEWFLNLFVSVCGRIPFLPDSLTRKILAMLRSGADGLASLRSGKAVLAITASSLVQWLLNGMIAYVALRAFGIPVTPATGLIVTGVTAVGVTIPSTPGFFGVIQVCFQISMNAQAVKPDPSLVLGASLYYHISMYIPVTVLGLYFFLRSGLSLRDLRRSASPLPENESADSVT